MAEHKLDSLSIDITANAQGANRALDSLEKHLAGVATSLSSLGSKSSGLAKFAGGVTQLSNAMLNFKNSGIGTADFSRLIKNLNALSTIDNAGIEATAKSLNDIGASMSSLQTVSENAVHITELAKALGKLGSKNAGQAITNIPQLATAMRDLLTTLSESPQISSDVLRMTEALADFVQGAKGYVSSAKSMESASVKIKVNVGYAEEALKKFSQTFKKVAKGLLTAPFKAFGNTVKGLASGITSALGKIKNFASQSEKAEKSVSKFATTIGTLYVKFWLLARVLSKVWSAVKGSFDYLETVNYFTSSFEAIAQKATNTMSDAGEESAQAFYKSFTDTAQSLTRKMTGFDISGGQLTMTKGANLGLDPNTTLTYQTTFAQIANSMGVASDKAVMLSNVLTEIGADLASVKNMDFEEVWQNMASAMVGMSRAVDKYGINIRASAMDEKLMQLGIQATSKELSQADKALLRTIIILDSAKYSFGDLADTLDMPANQIRMLTANLHKLAMMFGSLFLPILKKVLPYINAFVIALQRLMQTIMTALHIDLTEMLPKGGSGASDALSDVLDDAEGADEALEDAQEQAKKLKNNLLGIDELNIISENQDDKLNTDDLGVSGLLDEAFLDAVSEYQKAWDDAFSRLQNKAQEIADRIVEWAKKVWKPIGEAWDAVGDKVIEQFKYMAGEVGNLLKDIARDWARVWESDAVEKTFEHIFSSFGNLFELIGNLARQFDEAWNKDEKGYKILQATADIIEIITAHVEEMTASWAEWAGSLDFNPILESVLHLLEAIRDNADDILGIVDDFQTMFMQPTFSYIIEEFLPKLGDIFTKLVTNIDWNKLRDALQDLWQGLAILAQVLGNGLLDLLDKLADVIIEFVNGDYIKNFTRDFKELAESLKDAKDINDVFDALFDFGEGRVTDTAKLINKITTAFNEAFEKIDFKNLGKRVGDIINKIFETIDWQELGKAVSNIATGFFELIHGAVKQIKWFEVGQAIGEFLKGIEWLKIIKEVLSIIADILGGAISAWFGSLSKAPLETAIITYIAGVLLSGKIVNGVLKLVTGKGIFANILTALLGGGEASTGLSALSKIGGTASKASSAIGEVAGAESALGEAVATANAGLPMNLQFFSEAGGVVGGIISKISGIGLVIGGAITAIKNFVDQWQEGFNVIDAILTALGVALVAVGAIILGAPALLTAVIAGVVYAIGEGIVLIHQHWDEIVAWWQEKKEAIGKAFEGIGDKFKEIGETISQHWDEFKSNIETKWAELKTGFATFVEEWGVKITEWASQKWEDITNKVEEIRANIKQKWDEMKENFTSHIETWRGQITEWASTKWEEITNKLEEIRNSIQEKWSEMQQNFTDHISEWHNRITQWASERWNEITDKVAEVRDYIQDRWGEMKQHFEEHIKNWRESITEWATSKWDEITSTMDTIKNEIYDRWTQMKEDFDDFKQRWAEKIVEWASEKWDEITNAMSELREKIQEKWENFKEDFANFIKQWQEKIGEWAHEKWDSVVETLTNLKNKIKDKWENIKKDASDFWSKFKDDLKGFAEKASEGVVSGFEKLKTGLGEVWSNLKKEASDAFDAVKNKASDIWNNVKDTASNIADKLGIGSSSSNQSSYTSSNTSIVSSTISKASSALKNVGSALEQDFLKWRKKNYGYATGGFPEDGLFFANHSELVGKFSNGRTAVANNQQITDGIAQATYQAMMRANADSTTEELDLLRELIGAVKQGSKVVIDGREIVTAYDSRKVRNGYSFG